MPDAAMPTPTANNTESKPLLRYSLIKYTVKNTRDTIQNHFKYFIQLNYKIMPRPKGSPNKITSEVRSKLQELLDDLIESLDLIELDNNQKIKMLQIALQFTLPKLKQEVDEVEDVLLFLEEIQDSKN